MQNLLYYLLQIYFITPSNSKYFDLKIQIEKIILLRLHTHSYHLNYLSNNVNISSIVKQYFNNISMSIITCIMKSHHSILLQ